MRRYDESVEVRKGLVDGAEAPEQFLWRGRLWRVRVVIARWVETGAWWQSAQARTARGDEPNGEVAVAARPVAELLGEREVWRVEAAAPGRGSGPSGVVADLSFDWSTGGWRLVGLAD